MVKGETGLYIYLAKEIQKMDQEADQLGLPTFTLMETAGTALFYAIKKYITKSSRILVLCVCNIYGKNVQCIWQNFLKGYKTMRKTKKTYRKAFLSSL